MGSKSLLEWKKIEKKWKEIGKLKKFCFPNGLSRFILHQAETSSFLI